MNCYSRITIAIISLFTFIFLACNPSKNLKSLVYLNNVPDTSNSNVLTQYEPRIQAGDRLNITVSALNPASAAPYNLNGGSITGVSTPIIMGYLVENDGTISFPQLGRIKAAGLTRTELTNNLIPQLEKYLKDPVITVQYLNFKVTVLGEVGHPGPMSLPDGKLNILEAIGQSGDLTIFGRRDNVLVIREREGKRELGRVDLTSTKLFSSPYYQLRQNDIVYVEMNANKVAASDQTTFRNIGVITSIASVATSIIVLIINLIK